MVSRWLSQVDKARERDRVGAWSGEPDNADSNEERNEEEMEVDEATSNLPSDMSDSSSVTSASIRQAEWSARFTSPSRPSMMSGHRSIFTGSTEMSYRPSTQIPGRKALRTRYDEGELPEGPIDLTDLQRLISIGIIQKGSYAHVDDIYIYVAKVR